MDKQRTCDEMCGPIPAKEVVNAVSLSLIKKRWLVAWR
jgi:hypothetical protein